MNTTPYHNFVAGLSQALDKAKTLPLGGFPPAPRPSLPAGAPKALFFSPHPDDECISGGLAVRLLRETKMNVINVAVTQGSKKERQAERYRELQAACDYLGLGLVPTAPNGLEKINPKTRTQDPAHWEKAVSIIHGILVEHQPRVVLFPHERDWNSTHIGVYYLVTDALKKMPASFECYTVETEFWGAMDDPNLMVEMSENDLSDMIAALTFHVGEVNRNPYHLSLPAWMMDNVRRGGELVGGQGGAAPDYKYAALCRLRKWSKGQLNRFYEGGKQLPAKVNPATLLA
jgi:LmbE family N-acetylglucosaminyl deacetylase